LSSEEELPVAIQKLETTWRGIRGSQDIYKHYLLPRLLFPGIMFLLGLSITPLLLTYSLLGLLTLLLSGVSAWHLVNNLFTISHVYSAAPFEKFVTAFKADIKRPILVGAVNYKTRKIELSSNPDADWIVASGSLPVAFPRKLIGNTYYVDGGLRDIAPIEAVIERGATEIDIIFTDPLVDPESKDNPNLYDQLLLLLEVLSSEVTMGDLKSCEKDGVKIRIIQPNKVIMKSLLDFCPARIAENIDHGYDVGYML
jgi:predicted acylesterase/phospholipase RssA